MILLFTLLMLIFCIFLIIGLIKPKWLPRFYPNKYRTRKKSTLIFSLLIIVCMVGIAYFSPKLTPEQIAQRNQERAEKALEQSKKSSTENAVQQENDSEQQNISRENVSSSEDNKQDEPIQEKIENICKNDIPDGDELVEVKVNEDMSNENWGSGKNIILIYFKSQSGYRNAELEKVANIMKDVYSAELPISEVTIFTQDMSGKLIMKSTLSDERAAKIDWDHIRYSKFDKQLNEIWTVPALR